MNFFYNILPGVYLLFLIRTNQTFIDFTQKYKLFNQSNSSSGVDILVLIIFGLLFGFSFQILTKFIRFLGLDCKIVSKVVSNNKIAFTRAEQILNNHNLKLEEDIEKVQVFYLMDNYLNCCKANILPSYFSSRTSLWANLGWANLFLLLIEKSNIYHSLFYFIFFVISFRVFYSYLTSQFDTILKSFVMEKDNFNEFKKPLKKN